MDAVDGFMIVRSEQPGEDAYVAWDKLTETLHGYMAEWLVNQDTIEILDVYHGSYTNIFIMKRVAMWQKHLGMEDE